MSWSQLACDATTVQVGELRVKRPQQNIMVVMLSGSAAMSNPLPTMSIYVHLCALLFCVTNIVQLSQPGVWQMFELAVPEGL